MLLNRRRFGVMAAVLVLGAALMGALPVASASAADPKGPAGPVSGPKSDPPTTMVSSAFHEVRYDGSLWRRDYGVLEKVGDGWGNTRLITTFTPNNLLEVKGDELIEWIDSGNGLQRYHRDWGWSNARLITALDYYTFLSIKTDGSLWKWKWTGSGYAGTQVGNGWGNTRLIAGLSSNRFVEVKGDELVEWIDYGTGFLRVHRDWGWSDARLLAGMNEFRFYEVKTNGELWGWERPYISSYFDGYRADGGWDNARLIG